MFGLTRRLQVFAHSGPVDMRKSFFTLSGLVQSSGHDIIRGDVFIFLGKNRRLAKVLWFDGIGLILLAKRLEKGQFAKIWDRSTGTLTMSELSVFLDGSQEVSRGPIVQKTFSFEDSTPEP